VRIKNFAFKRKLDESIRDRHAEESAIGNLGAAFEFALKQREFEIAQLTQRNNFFMIFQGVLIAGLVQSGGNVASLICFFVCAIGCVVSILQVGMAAGSKYWQMRWERAARTVELWLLEDLRSRQGTIVQFFTVDGKYLTDSEIERLNKVNKAPERKDDQLAMEVNAIENANRAELEHGQTGLPNNPFNELILLKPSVSRIPIYVGCALVVFWASLLLNTVNVDIFSSKAVSVSFSSFRSEAEKTK